ncbi:Bile acid beta-glucosidase [Operophtera brumata]|uniref:Bile acid beta-glucosidase n=1 Tax=Operophtera brumata TaxID=104452 RepID=A0A0L7KZ39_OPEBR|nr:Bile acid beta-glucosidase [Operophtera brumata]
MKVRDGRQPHGDRTALQSEEMWTGVTYGLAATMIYEAARRPHGAAERGDVDRRHVRDGRQPHGDRTALQSEEMWTGVTYGLAATMIYEGT